MSQSRIALGSALAVLLLLAGCGKNVEERAASGGVSGAAAGALVGGPVGAVIGGAAGATGGTMIEKGIEEQDDETTTD